MSTLLSANDSVEYIDGYSVNELSTFTANDLYHDEINNTYEKAIERVSKSKHAELKKEFEKLKQRLFWVSKFNLF